MFGTGKDICPLILHVWYSLVQVKIYVHSTCLVQIKIYIYVLSFYMFGTDKDIYMSSHSTCIGTDKDIYMSSHSTCLVQVKIYICPLILHVWYR